jgi:hypothetical protein
VSFFVFSLRFVRRLSVWFVCLSGLFVWFVCLVCLSVCLSVFLFVAHSKKKKEKKMEKENGSARVCRPYHRLTPSPSSSSSSSGGLRPINGHYCRTDGRTDGRTDDRIVSSPPTTAAAAAAAVVVGAHCPLWRFTFYRRTLP